MSELNAPAPPLSRHELIDLEFRLGAYNYDPLDVVISRGQGVWESRRGSDRDYCSARAHA